MEFVPGSSLTDDRILDISDSKIRRTIRDYARFCVSITKLQFSQIGSLTRSPNGKLYVGPLVKGRAASSKAALFLGPFESQAHRYLSAIDEKLQNWSAAAGPCGQSPIVTYLIQREVREMIAQDEEMNQAATCTYIRHEELAPHNFMVDDEGSITAVIDWDWCVSALPMEACVFLVRAQLISVGPMSPPKKKPSWRLSHSGTTRAAAVSKPIPCLKQKKCWRERTTSWVEVI